MNVLTASQLAVSALMASTLVAQPAGDSRTCPYTAAEVRLALNLEVAEGLPAAPVAFPGGKRLSCRYNALRGATASLWLTQDAYDNPRDPSIAMMARMRAGTFQPVADDADGAEFQEQGDLTNATLHYLRKGVQVEARVTIGPRDAGFAAMKGKLLKLRRIP